MMHKIQVLAGCMEPEKEAWNLFDRRAMIFLEELSNSLRADEGASSYPEVKSFGFWCRKSHLQDIMKHHQREGDYQGRGLMFQIVASNVPILFAYSLVISMMCGNANQVRLSQRASASDLYLVKHIKRILEKDCHRELWNRTSIITYEREDCLTEKLLNKANGYLVWGGDETIGHIRSLVKNPDLTELVFPDRYSICILSEKKIRDMDADMLQRLAHGFYQDTYAMEQNACASPSLICWLQDGLTPLEGEDVHSKFFRALKLEMEAESYQLTGDMGYEKWETISRMVMTRPEISCVENQELSLMVASVLGIADSMEAYRGRFGLFYQARIEQIEELGPYTTDRLQTITFCADCREEVLQAVKRGHFKGVSRIVPVGEALQMDVIWDGKNLLDALTKCIG